MRRRALVARGAARLLPVLALLALAASAAPAAGGEAATDGLPAWLLARIEAWVVARLPEEPAHAAIPPVANFVPPDLDPAAVEVHIESPAQPPLRGRVPLVVSVRRGGEVLARGEVTVEVTLLDERLVATRTLERGEIVRPEHLERRALAPGARPRGEPVAAEALVGRRTKRRVPRGALWQEDWVEDAPLVVRGQPVRVRYERGALRIEGSAIARDEARIGEMVRVQNPTSRRELVGRLGPDGAVHVSF